MLWTGWNLHLYYKSSLLKPLPNQLWLSITPEVCSSTWNRTQTCAEHMRLASVTAVVGSTRETLSVRLAVNDKRWIPKNRKFPPTSFWQKIWKSLDSGIDKRWEERILLYSCTFQFFNSLTVGTKWPTLYTVYFFNGYLYSNSPKCFIPSMNIMRW